MLNKLLLILALLCFVGCQPNGYHVVAYTAAWCQPCQRDKPSLATLDVPLTMVDIDLQSSMAIHYGVSRVPTYIVYRNGVEVERTHDVQRVITLCRPRPSH